jgi:hypothetical protein
MGGNPEMRVKWPKKNPDGSLAEGTDEGSEWKDIYQQVTSERKSHIKSENERVKEKIDAQARQVQVTNRITVQQLDPFERKKRIAAAK